MDALTLRSHLFTGSFKSSISVRHHIIAYARSSFCDVLRSGLTRGQLILEDVQGVFEFGTPDNGYESVRLKVLNENMWGRIFLSHDIGLAEAFMQGDFEVSSLKGLLNLWLDNREGLSGLSTTISSVFAYYSAVAINSLFRQNLKGAKRSVEVSYDVSNKFMECFLSKDMMYSSAIWDKSENGPRGDLTVGPVDGDLEAAQLRKIHHFLKAARLRPGDRLLEIGSGWGAMSIEAARLGCSVDTVTLSREQKTLADERIASAGFSDLIQVHLCDYRQLPASFENSFDACISCEMIEAVGPSNYPDYFRMIDWALKPDRGTIVISSTTQPEHRYSAYQPEDFARRYHWPNNHAPSPTSLILAVQNAVQGKLVLHSIEDHGIHYPRTLREWRRRMDKNFHGDLVTFMQERYPDLRDKHNLEAFRKKWEYLFVYAEVGYARAYTSLHFFTFTRPENVSEICS